MEAITRARLDPSKVDHFLDFISRPNFVQDVAYGTKTLKLSNGEKMEIPNVVRTVIASRIVDLYQQYCQETGFLSHGRSTLFSILQICAASQKKSLAGLDNIAAEGSQAFDTLEDVVNRLGKLGKLSSAWVQGVKDRLKAGKSYLKTNFKIRVSEESQCADHCRVFALSDPEDHLCEHEHTKSCQSCDNIKNVLEEIELVLSSRDLHFRYQDEKGELEHDISNAIDKIERWKAHILRAVHQDVAKDDILNNMTPEQALIIMDWAMKFLPLKYRETQGEWFGKKGLSWHVTAVITKPKEEFEVRTYVHLLDHCSQNWFAVASIYENTLMEIKRKSPEINEAFVRSDNAGCYHCALLLLSIPGISQRTGVTTSRYDFSESNSGKDICDRHISPLKSHIRQYVNAGNDVEKAKDMKKAIDSYSGVRGCRASVVKVDTCAQDLHNHNWNGVLMFSNFKFCADGIRMWKAFNAGEGKFVRYDKLMKRGTSQGSTRLEVIEPFTSPRVSTGFLYKNSKTTENKSEPCEFSCPQPDCIKLFKTTTALQNHQDFGKHIFCTQKDSTHDSIKRKWANACTNLRPSYIPSKKNLEGLSQEECREYPTAEPGWALKKNKKTGRFS
ncbi:unnamed protein product [Porites evermanni]|uniref:C2H2-type domain-containing protein n=1 Tax=Porites evermanni TaxID=104178 RepID=A0ABN8LW03_9CNID|nr:unnamed protein product [Porites evermanni]